MTLSDSLIFPKIIYIYLARNLVTELNIPINKVRVHSFSAKHLRTESYMVATITWLSFVIHLLFVYWHHARRLPINPRFTTNPYSFSCNVVRYGMSASAGELNATRLRDRTRDVTENIDRQIPKRTKKGKKEKAEKEGRPKIENPGGRGLKQN